MCGSHFDSFLALGGLRGCALLYKHLNGLEEEIAFDPRAYELNFVWFEGLEDVREEFGDPEIIDVTAIECYVGGDDHGFLVQVSDNSYIEQRK